MSLAKHLKLVGILVVMFMQIGTTYAEPSAIASGLADYLEEHRCGEAATIRPHIATYAFRSADGKALFLALPWIVTLVVVLRSK
jgi:hypothetical protein